MSSDDHREELGRRMDAALASLRAPMPSQQALGRLTALICGPTEVPPDVWLPSVLEGSPLRRGPELDAGLTELLRCHELLAGDLARGLPVGPIDEAAAASAWCRGYQLAASTSPKWAADARGQQLLLPFVQLAAWEREDPKLALPAKGAPERWDRAELPMLAAAVHAHFEADRRPELRGAAQRTNARELPCSCGSRRRYRNCCSLN